MQEFFRFVILFFKGGQKKIGVVTLVMACLAMAGWVRSFSSSDFFQWNLKAFGFAAVSIDNVFVVIFGTFNEPFVWSLPEFSSSDFSTLEDACHAVNWQWSFVGLRFGGEATSTPSEFLYCTAIGYPWIVISLALLSTYLLLSKPHESNPKKVTDPTANEGE